MPFEGVPGPDNAITDVAGVEVGQVTRISGDGPLKVLWTDAGNQDHSMAGPVIREGDEGTLLVTIRANDAVWDVKANAAQ